MPTVRQRLEQFFDEGVLVRPTDRKPNLVHVSRAVAALAGVPDLAGHPITRQIMEWIGPAEHLVFVLLDGLGMNLVRCLPPESFIRTHIVSEIHATCPSTTACALSTVATAQYPNRHGTAGWFTYIPELDLTVTSLPFTDRRTGEPLTARGIGAEQVLLLPPIFPKMKHHPLTIVPALIANTTYNVYMRGGTSGAGYFSFAHAMDRIIGHINESPGPTYTHLYLPEIDTICHKRGIEHPDVIALVMQIDEQLDRLARTLAGRARIVVSADHGLIDVPVANQALLLVGDPMLELLQVPPTGDARMPVFHVREGNREQFVELFQQRYAQSMLLLATDELEQMELCGPGLFSPRARGRFGDFVGVPFCPATLAFHPPHKPLGELYQSVHAGMSPEEMEVPLAIA